MDRDDIIEYSLDAHHSEEKGVELRKQIWKVTGILSLITIVEVAVGIMWGRGAVEGAAWQAIKYGYIILTLVKAWYIVMSFMHLGDERKSLQKTILYPYIVFILYLLFICWQESTHIREILDLYI